MNDPIVDALCDSVDAMVEQSREDAWEELSKENSLREAAHAVTMGLAQEQPCLYDWSGHYCRYCGAHWSNNVRQARAQQHRESCIWRMAKVYADAVSGG